MSLFVFNYQWQMFNEEDDLASIYTYNMRLKSRPAKISRECPEICRRKETHKQGAYTYLIDKSRMSIHLVTPYSKERIDKTVEILNKNKKESREKG